MGDVVIVAYRPKPGCAQALLGLAKGHVAFLRRLGLATDRPATLLQAKDGAIVEIFEWRPGAMDEAHENPEVQKLWDRYAEVCDYVPLSALPEGGDLFAAFTPVD
jgi:hypothetical protein